MGLRVFRSVLGVAALGVAGGGCTPPTTVLRPLDPPPAVLSGVASPEAPPATRRGRIILLVDQPPGRVDVSLGTEPSGGTAIACSAPCVLELRPGKYHVVYRAPSTDRVGFATVDVREGETVVHNRRLGTARPSHRSAAWLVGLVGVVVVFVALPSRNRRHPDESTSLTAERSAWLAFGASLFGGALAYSFAFDGPVVRPGSGTTWTLGPPASAPRDW